MLEGKALVAEANGVKPTGLVPSSSLHYFHKNITRALKLFCNLFRKCVQIGVNRVLAQSDLI